MPRFCMRAGPPGDCKTSCPAMQRARGRLVAPPLVAALRTSLRAPHLRLYTRHFVEPARWTSDFKIFTWIFVAYLHGG
jgi:hypothetical protein